jgi:hypothetical protein
MRRIALAAIVAALLVTSATAASIRGDYLESRSADVYVAQCFANGEVGLTGDTALMAWRVREGSWNGVKLDGLSVVAAIKASATLGDPYGEPLPARAVLIVDERADSAQRDALVSFAQAHAGVLLANVERVIAQPIVLRVPEGHSGKAMLRAGNLAEIQTRLIGANDHICGNEETFYPPLVDLKHSMVAVAETDEFQGPGLGLSWELHGKRSAFVGQFEK